MPETRVLVAPHLKDELEQDGLLELDALTHHEDKKVVKARLSSRQTYRLRTSAGRVLYLKLYHEIEAEKKLAGLFAQRFDSPASREWHVCKRLLELGIPTMHPAACIEETDGDRVIRAALLTVGLEAPVSLQSLILEEFSEYPQAQRRQFIARDLGAMLRKMHDGGVNHRDFYLVHIRVG